MKAKKTFPLIFSPVAIVFFFSWMYWIYLASSSQMIIGHDAVGYERLGRLLAEQGFGEYLRTGPNREPFYPFIIAVSMKCERLFSISYQTIQMFIQIIFLFSTQLLIHSVLKKLNIRSWLSAITLLYIGFSPALINSTFCLYSEIATFPFILIAILLSWHAIQDLDETKPSRPILKGLLLGGCFLILTFTKAIFELITPLFLMFIVILLLRERPKQNKILLIVLSALLIFYVPLISYKWANKKYNGNYSLTDRGAWALYGNTERRLMPLTKERFLSCLASVPGYGFCNLFFKQETCRFWSYETSDDLGARKRQEVERLYSRTEKVNNELLRLSVKKVLEQPFQYALIWFVESFKMFFWESLAMAYVLLSNQLLNIYNVQPLQIMFFAIPPLFSCAGILYSCFFLIKHHRSLDRATFNLLSLTVVLIILYNALYSLFFINARYAFPIASLYLILFAFSTQSLLDSFKKKAPLSKKDATRNSIRIKKS
jgi:hypothetical protein